MEEPKMSSMGADLKFDPKDVEANKAIACLSYLGIFFLIPLLAKKDSKFAQEHAKQGMVMFIAALLGVIPFIGQLWLIVVVVIDIMAIIKTLQGQYWKIPKVFELSRKFNF